MNFYYNKLGKILEGDNVGWYVRIINDFENTGGFIILEFKDLDEKEGFDTWLESEKDIEGYIYESEWKIEWIEEPSNNHLLAKNK